MKGLDADSEWEELKSEMKKQLRIYLDSPKFKSNVEKVNPASSELVMHLQDMSTLMGMTKREDGGREIATILVAVFLWNYETFYMFFVDYFCHVLVANGHDLFNSFKRKYAVSFADIGEVDAATKLGFLDEHNLRGFNRKQDRELRNKIAHHDFLLDETGKIRIDGVEINVFSRHQDLMNFVIKVLFTFCECLEEIGNPK